MVFTGLKSDSIIVYEDGELNSSMKFEYDDKDRCKKVKFLHPNGDTGEEFVFYKNDKDSEAYKRTHYLNGQLECEYTYEKDCKGILHSTTIRNSLGQMKTRYFRNENGEMIEVKNI